MRVRRPATARLVVLTLGLGGCGSGAPPRLPPPAATPESASVVAAPPGDAPVSPRLDDRRLGRSGLACVDCHPTTGTLDALRPAPPLSGLAARMPLWSGLAPTVEVAVNLCVERWLMRPSLTGAPLAALAAAADGPGTWSGASTGAPLAGVAVASPVDADAASTLPEGDPARGRVLYDAACRHCHEDGPGAALWGRAWSRAVVARAVRGIDRPRHPGTLMPPFGPEVLSDAALADLTTALAEAAAPGL